MNLHFLKQCLAEILLTGRVGHSRLDRFYRLYLNGASLKGKSSKNGTVPARGLSQAFAVQTTSVP